MRRRRRVVVLWRVAALWEYGRLGWVWVRVRAVAFFFLRYAFIA